MADEQELYEIEVAEWLRETEKAWQIKTTAGTEHWIPKGQIVEKDDTSMLIPLWLADKARISVRIEEAEKRRAA